MFQKAALALMLGFPLVAAAQDASPPATVATAADFSAGFQKLVQLGLPSLEGAEWTTTGDESRFDVGDKCRQRWSRSVKRGGHQMIFRIHQRD